MLSRECHFFLASDCLFHDVNFLGGGLTAEEGGQGIETSDFAECGQECRNRARCSHWTFVGKWKVNCYLKHKLGEKSEFEGAVSGEQISFLTFYLLQRTEIHLFWVFGIC